MPHSGESRRDDLFIRHLLGELSEDETQQVEEDSVIDDAAAARLARVENDLVDAYVRGTMTEERRRRFDAVYLSTPLRREKVAFAKRFLAAVDAETPGRDADARRVRARAPHWVSWSIAAAAALFLVTGALLVRDVRLRRAMDDARTRLTIAEQRADTLSAQLSEQQRATAVARQELADAQNAQAWSPPATPAIAIVLAPQTRGLERMPVATVPAEARDLPLDLTIDRGSASRYSVSLKDPASNAIVWRSRPLTPDRRREPSVVRVHVPAALLKTQHYALDLFSMEDGAAVFVGTYAFEIVRP